MSFSKAIHLLFTKLKLITIMRLGVIRFPYQPVPYSSGKSRRYQGTIERWNATVSVLDKTKSCSVLDVGCNTGFFSIEMAKRGNFCVGVDTAGKQLMVANAIKDLYQLDGVTFTRMKIDPENVSSLPHFDTTFCLSIFHHWALQYGAAGAISIMKTLADRTNGMLIFETAQTDNCSEKYRKALPDMGTEPKKWLEEFILDLGFNEVVSLGQFGVIDTDDDTRELMMGKKY